MSCSRVNRALSTVLTVALVVTASVLLNVPSVAYAAASSSRSWSGPIAVNPGGGKSLSAVACPATSQCTATDGNGRVVTFNPTSPGTPVATPIDPSYALPAIACPSASQCTAVDDGGQQVTFNPTSPGSPTPTTVDSVGSLVGVACPSTSQCTAVDSAGRQVTFNPTSPGSPTPTTVFSDGITVAIACPSTSQCTVADSWGRAVTFNPSAPGTPTPTTVDSGFPVADVACPSATQCTVVDGGGREVTFNPTSPGSPSATSLNSAFLVGLACPSTSQCTGATGDGKQVTFNPTTGSVIGSSTQIATAYSLTDIACPSTTQCTAADSSGQEVTFTPSSPGTPSPVLVDRGGMLTSVACPTASQCTAVDALGQQVTFDPTSIGTPTPSTIDAGYRLNAVACPSASQCTGVDGAGRSATFDPASPGSVKIRLVDPGIQQGIVELLAGVACPSTSQCTAVDNNGRWVTFDPGVTGTVTPSPSTPVPHTISSVLVLAAVACPSTSECIAVSTDGTESTFNPLGSTFAGGSIDPGHSLSGVACPSVSQCIAVDDAGRQLTFNPASPGTPTASSVDSGNKLLGIACPATDVCVAVDNRGNVVESDPASPGAAVVASVSDFSLSSVSCSSVEYCVTVDGVGNAYLGIAPPENTAAPSISGTAAQAQLLTEVHGSWTNSPTSYGYQWQRCDNAGNSCASVAGATNQTYTLVAGDVGHTMRVQETASNAGGSSTPVTSAPTAVVVPLPPSSTSPPSISGTAGQGQLLTEVHGSWTNSPTGYAYQWLRCDELGNSCGGLAGATNQTYTVVAGDVGHTIRVQETASNAGGSSTPAMSAQTAVVVPPAPSNVTKPSISGEVWEGGLLTEAPGSWTNSPTAYTYQWQRCDDAGNSCLAIAGATGQTYTLVHADVGHDLRVQETASNAGGSSAPATSDPIGVVSLPPAPSNLTKPSISGEVWEGGLLTEAHGTWTNSPTSYTYQWQRCDDAGNTCAAIAGATNQTYSPVAADVGHDVRVQETASNAGGSSPPATSDPAGVISLPPAPSNLAKPSISGQVWAGGLLTEAPGSWTYSPTSYTYQWQRCDDAGNSCAAIAGATGQTYLLVDADVGHDLRVQETASNAGGSSAPATSDPIGVVADVSPPVVAFTAKPVNPTKSRSAHFAVSATDVSAPVTFVCKLDSSTAVSCPSAIDYGSLADGVHTFVVTGTDAVGNTSAPLSFSWRIDNVAPAVTLKTPTAAFALGSTAPVSWSGSDSGSGVAKYQLGYERAPWNGVFGSWTFPTSWQALTSTALAAPLAVGYTYCYSVRAFDKAGNVSAWTAVRCTARPLDDRAMGATTSGWTRATSSLYYLGTYTSTTTLNAKLARTGVVLDRVGIVATRCPTCGVVGVYVGSTLIGKINLYSATTQRKVVLALPRFSLRTGTVTVKVLTSGKLVQVDGLAVSRA
jgi:hypothetical protein